MFFRRKMVRFISVKALYPLALAEGEGVGTAYEYFAKRLVLRRWLKKVDVSGRLLVAGLPQKYGASLDFLLLAQELSLEAIIVDERSEALEKASEAFSAAQSMGLLLGLAPTYKLVDDLSEMSDLSDDFACCLSSEVLQRLPVSNRSAYWQRLLEMAGKAAVFAPNAGNPAHTNLSGLSGLHLSELQPAAGAGAEVGYIDMPHFPPGITRTDNQREQATNGWLEALAMRGLGWYARMERFFPQAVRRRQSHIVYALSG
jgi:hypothetical protein